MRIFFLVFLLGASIFYSYIAFADLNFMTRTGRLGPGFFPRLIGISGVVLTLWALLDALRDRRPDLQDGSSWADLAKLVALALSYAVMMRLFGGFWATFLYLAATLTVINAGRHIQNAVIAVAVPICVYLLFDKLLNASMPPALFDLPI